MKRRLFNLAATVSLVLCAAITVLWARSYRTADTVARYEYPMGAHQCFTARGSIFYFRHYSSATDRTVWWVKFGAVLPPKQQGSMLHPVLPGIDFFRGPVLSVKNTPVTATFMRVSLWWLIGVSAVAPVFAGSRFSVTRWVRARRLASARCPSCGYDLRASPEQCPECGDAVPKPTLPAPA